MTDSSPDFPKLKESAENGCDFCSFLRNTLLSPEVDFDADEIPRIRSTYRDAGNQLLFHRAGYHLIPYDFTSHDEGKFWLSFEIWIRHGDMILLPSLFLRDPPKLRVAPPREVLQSTTNMFVRQAIERCDAHHDKCKLGRDPAFLPTRLVDVRDENAVRLVEGFVILAGDDASSSSAPKYAALSYCWGPRAHADQQLKTTDDNIAQHLVEIPMKGMPAVLKDAIHATRELGIPFIWIDCLCIIQGNQQDWEREASSMHKVYGSAYITLCPTLSKSCLNGFLFRDAPSIVLPYRSLKGQPAGIYRVRYTRSWIWKMYYVVPGHPFSRDLISGSWVRRGWTFQEAALSSRMVLFGASATHFHCRTSRVTEGEDNEIPVSLDDLDLFPLLPSTLAGDKLGEAWKHIVASYSQRNFTKRTDAIAALAGLAHRFHSLQETDEYCSGMWLSQLHEQLLWRCAMHERILWERFVKLLDPELPEQVRLYAPSWSWIHRINIDYQYIRGSVLPSEPEDDGSDGHGDMSTTPFPGLTNETLRLAWRLPDKSGDESPEVDRFMQWRGQELEITGMVARFPFANADKPLEVDDLGEANTNLFWKWTISGQYFYHTNWDYLNYDLWNEVDKDELQHLRMLLLSSGRGKSPHGKAAAGDRNIKSRNVEEEVDRAAFGLLLFPTVKESENGKYYRVGTWHSLFDGKGGLARFIQYATVESLVLV
ncbi:HET domain protein [Trichoderma parareesei]|uniref:HET domain protein n=1 Tax=Trichoderma parareesei TaxID=858221 RepID=A0A2H2ZSK3_TRIPA|nr:HET domain protein [Trichoderma parareesei]